MLKNRKKYNTILKDNDIRSQKRVSDDLIEDSDCEGIDNAALRYSKGLNGSQNNPVDAKQVSSSDYNDNETRSSNREGEGDMKPQQLIGSESEVKDASKSDRSNSEEPNSREQEETNSGNDSLYDFGLDEEKEYEEGRDNWESSVDFDGESDPLLLSLRIQKERMASTVLHDRSSVKAKELLKNDSGKRSKNFSGITLSLKDKWGLEVSNRDELFFDSD